MYRRFALLAGHGRTAHRHSESLGERRNWADYMEAGTRQIALEALGHACVRNADFYYQLFKWVTCLEAEASVDHTGMERANAREQLVLSHLWQVQG